MKGNRRGLKQVLDKVEEQAKPKSIFLYGSRARKDFKEESDYEVGVLFERSKKWSRSELAKLHTLEGLNLYPFAYEDFVENKLDTPFPKAVYMKELVEGAKTLRGEEVIEGMKSPEIKLSDLLEAGTFQVAYALAAVLSSRQEDWITSSIEFTKSVFFGTRVLIILEKGKFPLSYDEIVKEAEELDLEEDYKSLVQHALKVRKGAKIDVGQLYTNITFLNQVILQRIKKELQEGDRIVLE